MTRFTNNLLKTTRSPHGKSSRLTGGFFDVHRLCDNVTSPYNLNMPPIPNGCTTFLAISSCSSAKLDGGSKLLNKSSSRPNLSVQWSLCQETSTHKVLIVLISMYFSMLGMFLLRVVRQLKQLTTLEEGKLSG